MRFTDTQIQRLRALGCAIDEETPFADADQRNRAFKERERQAIKTNRALLQAMRSEGTPVSVNALAGRISSYLRERGFLEVSTPILISSAFLDRMTIDHSHSLHSQVFWVDEKTCLRPMLAPGLYDISRRLIDILGTPLGVFEIGSCFRKESRGSQHLECFTMVNFVEWGIPEKEKHGRAEQMVADLMAYLELDYELVQEESTVYGMSLDVVVSGHELASGAFGPHPLDPAWNISTTWYGFGMGIERAVCLMQGIDNVQRVGRSTTYHNGIGLNFK